MLIPIPYRYNKTIAEVAKYCRVVPSYVSGVVNFKKQCPEHRLDSILTGYGIPDNELEKIKTIYQVFWLNHKVKLCQDRIKHLNNLIKSINSH